MDHEREDSMEDMIGSIPPSMRLNQYPKLSINYSAALLENDQNLLEGLVGNDGGVNATNSPKPDLAVALKRPTPSSLFWTDDEDHSGVSSSKRMHFENSSNGQNSTTSSLATLLTNLPQTPPLHHHTTMMGSIGDGLFRPAYQIPGANWYS